MLFEKEYSFLINKNMKIYYQWNPWSYMNIAAKKIKKHLNIQIDDIVWMPEFNDVWKNIWIDWIWVLAIENSYMWSIHPNMYGFLKHDFKIIWEYYLEINHCLCSKEKNIEISNFWDTALAAKYVSESQEIRIGAICSTQAAKLHKLNILDENIQDQNWNTTRFIVIVPKWPNIKYNKKAKKISIIFEAKNIPSSLYKCLWAFATNKINLTKIESLPSYKWAFSYYFWLEFGWKIKDKDVSKALEELNFFAKKVRILWEY